MLRPLVLLLLEVNLVTAVRDNQALAQQKSTICWKKCCRPKCGGQGYSLKESKGNWTFQDCEVREGAQDLQGYGRVCFEDCTVVHSGEPQNATVMRRSGIGSSPQCELYHRDLPLQELAMDFVEQLEISALKLTDGNSRDLPLMKAGKVQSFLEKVQQEVLKPEFEKQGYSQEIKSKNVVIIGDLHGQLFNLIGYLLYIKSQSFLTDKGFKMLEGSSLLFCDPGFQYVFMGDYVDRGERGVELLLLLLAYKARCPEGMALLQGNHETTEMWSRYGFAAELKWKFDRSLHVARVADVVKLLPYVAVAPENWMAMHGGLSPELESACSGKGGRFSECLTKDVGHTTVWADPHDDDGFIPSERGGDFHQFGMDVARRFLESNNLKGIYRGHEAEEKGWVERKKDRYFVTTVFSAADYTGLFCLYDGRPPDWDKDKEWWWGTDMWGFDNLGALVFAEMPEEGKFRLRQKLHRIRGSENRIRVSRFTEAQCKGAIRLLKSQSESLPKVTLESFIEENHKSIKRLGDGNHGNHGNHGNLDSCSLDKDETEAVKEKTRQILANAENREFEARKLIDLQGEALIHGENLEICKAMKKDKAMLEVYNELDGTDEKILEEDIETREHELEEVLE